MSDKRDVLERAIDFALLALPGQPRFMHMGTSYLVNDLATEVRKLRAANADLLSLAKQYADECAECGGTGSVWDHPRDPQDAKEHPCPDCADIRRTIEKAEGTSL